MAPAWPVMLQPRTVVNMLNTQSVLVYGHEISWVTELWSVSCGFYLLCFSFLPYNSSGALARGCTSNLMRSYCSPRVYNIISAMISKCSTLSFCVIISVILSLCVIISARLSIIMSNCDNRFYIRGG
jgi:hypothetical protein